MVVKTLVINDFKSLEHFEVSPPNDTRLVILEARNMRGKTTVLEAIKYAIGGGKFRPLEPVRTGQESGDILLRTEDFTITLKFDKKGHELELVKTSGEPVKAAVTFLKDFYNALSFDPFEFSDGDDKTRKEMLKVVTGLDTSHLDARYSIIYKDRHTTNQNLKTAQHEFSRFAYDGDAPKEPISLEALTEKMQALANKNAENERKRNEAATARTTAEALQEKLKAKGQRIEDMKRILAEHEAEAVVLAAEVLKATEAADEVASQLATLQDEDLGIVSSEMREAEALNARYRANLEYFKAQQAVDDRKAESEAMTGQLKGILAQKSEMLANAKMPLRGLLFVVTEIEDKLHEELYYLGHPFDEASAAERLTASVEIGFALNPEFRAMLVRDASLLDDERMKLMFELARKHEGQIWLERVSTSHVLTVRFEQEQAS